MESPWRSSLWTSSFVICVKSKFSLIDLTSTDRCVSRRTSKASKCKTPIESQSSFTHEELQRSLMQHLYHEQTNTISSTSTSSSKQSQPTSNDASATAAAGVNVTLLQLCSPSSFSASHRNRLPLDSSLAMNLLSIWLQNHYWPIFRWISCRSLLLYWSHVDVSVQLFFDLDKYEQCRCPHTERIGWPWIPVQRAEKKQCK